MEKQRFISRALDIAERAAYEHARLRIIGEGFVGQAMIISLRLSNSGIRIAMRAPQDMNGPYRCYAVSVSHYTGKVPPHESEWAVRRKNFRKVEDSAQFISITLKKFLGRRIRKTIATRGRVNLFLADGSIDEDVGEQNEPLQAEP